VRKLLTTAVFIVLSIPLNIYANQPNEQTVIRTAEDWLHDVSQGDRTALNSITDSAFIATTPAGDVLTKDRLIPEQGAVQRLPQFTLQGPTVRIAGSTAVLMGRLHAAEQGGDLNSTFVFISFGTKWKLVGLHLSPQK
jgi:Domain of unknown function (DUF4440)